MSDYGKCPHRAFRLTFVLDADTREDLAHALYNFASRVERNEMSTGVTGGPTDGSVYELLHDPAQTHEEYFKQVHSYLEARKATPPAPTGE